MKRILFVCLGNICRSPTAEAVFTQQLRETELATEITVDSCGTGAWHVGHSPDQRTIEAAAKRGYDLTELRARKLVAEDFKRFDYILAMDTRNLADILKKAPSDFPGKIQLFLDYAPESNVIEVPDPYYGGDQGFERVLDLVEYASQGLLKALKNA